jgi:hypothetical protein
MFCYLLQQCIEIWWHFFNVMNFGNVFSKIIEVANKNFQNFAIVQNFKHRNYATFYIITLDK